MTQDKKQTYNSRTKKWVQQIYTGTGLTGWQIVSNTDEPHPDYKMPEEIYIKDMHATDLKPEAPRKLFGFM
jgi:hypothetical protein